MKKCLALLAFALLPALSLRAQTTTDVPAPAPSEVERPSQDHIMLQFTYENWSHSSDSINITGIGRGFNGYLCYDFPFQKSHFSFGAGIGVGTSNIYFKDQELVLTDSSSSAAYFRPETKDYKRFKLTTAYLEAPFELRYFGNIANRNKGFKAAIGFRAGTLIGAHTKGRTSVDGSKLSEKWNTRRFLENWRFAGTVRVGWGNFSLFGSYNLNTLFKEGQGPDVTPYSAGICITGL